MGHLCPLSQNSPGSMIQFPQSGEAELEEEDWMVASLH